MDALNALRETIQAQRPISYFADGKPTTSLQAATHIVLSPTTTLPKSTPTRWRRDATATDPHAEPQRFFALDALVLTWSTRNENAATYMRQATTSGVNYVSLTDRKAVVDWLEGKVDVSDKVAPVQESTTPTSPPPTTASLSPSKRDPHGAPSTARHTGSVKRGYVPDATDIEAVKKIRANEVELRDRNTVLRGVKVNNFTQIKEYVSQLKSAAKGPKVAAVVTPTASSVASTSSAASPSPAAASKAAGGKKSRVFPIIMVSSSPTALLTLHNIKKFLEESIYEPSEVARQRNGGAKTEDVIPIYRKRTHIGAGGKEVETRVKYFAVDGVDALGKFGADAWDRVVCVMTTGQEWQFKPYKWTEPRQLFHNVKGIYFTWTNDPPNSRIKDWNVSELKIDQYKRHVDKSVVAHFWRLLDAWMTTHKPALLL
ncbi:accessory factor associated with RNA polymerase II [Tulasnella sp. 403]|nr:accessory factor associated with RNA polymerase II [Tulasnella sp. 403]